jgi:putative oxidoreductase
MNIKEFVNKIPDFCMSHWLLRIPLAIIFLQQGLSKFPIDQLTAEAYGLSEMVWWFVALGEVGAGAGLIIGGILSLKIFWPWVGDLISRFSGFTIGCIVTGIIWTTAPTSLLDVLLYDNFHVLLWVGGLFFALRGNKT